LGIILRDHVVTAHFWTNASFNPSNAQNIVENGTPLMVEIHLVRLEAAIAREL